MNHITQLINTIKAQYPSLTDIQAIGRQNEDGVIVIDNQVYGGISDKKGNYAYIRYRGRNDWNHSRAVRQLSSIRTSIAEAELRLVVVHSLDDVESFVTGLTEVMTGVFNCNAQASIEIVSTDQDRNRILKEETKGENGKWNQNIGLVRVDFNFSYSYTGKACDPADLCGGGTSPVLVVCPTLCEQIEESTAIQIVECFDEVKEDAIKELICDPCPPCEDATYSNGGAFVQSIPSGGIYVAPQVVITDVDGTTRNILPNINDTCEWKALQPRSSDGAVNIGAVVAVYPAGGIIPTGDQRVRDQANVIVASPVVFRRDIRIMNTGVTSVVTSAATTEITVAVPVCPSPSGIAYQDLMATQRTSYRTGDEGSRIQVGYYNMTSPAYPATYARLDMNATNPFITLVDNNIHGNKSRFTDTSGNGLDYSSTSPANGIVEDHYYKGIPQWYVNRTAVANWNTGIDEALASGIGGGGWYIPCKAEIHSLIDSNNTNGWNNATGTPPGFTSSSLISVITSTTFEQSTTNCWATFSNGNRRTLTQSKANTTNYIMIRKRP